MFSKVVFLTLLLFVALPTPLSSPSIALALGAMFGLTMPHPFPQQARVASRYLLQASVVGLGFGISLQQVLRAGARGFAYTLIGIAFAMATGMLLAKWLGVRQRAGYLISVGTAICGGSAIAAVAPVMNASDEEVSVSIGTVFLLNAAGLLLFPVLGHAMGMSEPAFGMWSALAIHDTSSVAGATAQYGLTALAVGTTVKLARALWIVPVTVATAMWQHRTSGEAKRGIEWPWFIGLFVVAAAISSYVRTGDGVYPWLVYAARKGLIVTLLLIGSGITRESLRRVGARPLLQGLLLWIAAAAFSLWLVNTGWIALAM